MPLSVNFWAKAAVQPAPTTRANNKPEKYFIPFPPMMRRMMRVEIIAQHICNGTCKQLSEFTGRLATRIRGRAKRRRKHQGIPTSMADSDGPAIFPTRDAGHF